jgi:CRISPR-associated protein Csy2
MSQCPSFNHLLVFPHLQIQNANAISSPQTHGFPSMTAFLGLMWALERKARSAGIDISFRAVGVICHHHQELVTEEGFVKSFRLTRNPVDKDGSTAAIVEEGRIHLELSLVLAINTNSWTTELQTRQADVGKLASILSGMRIAGGTLIPPAMPWRRQYQPYVVPLTGTQADRQTEFHKAHRRWLPGFTLVARDKLLDECLSELRTENAAASPLDAWLSLSRINWRYHQDDKKESKSGWVNDRTGRGWIVPIPVGYGALGEVHEPGSVVNARDATTPFRFVESLYSVGEWISPHRLTKPEELLWYAESQPDSGLYRCRNDYTVAQTFNFD